MMFKEMKSHMSNDEDFPQEQESCDTIKDMILTDELKKDFEQQIT